MLYTTICQPEIKSAAFPLMSIRAALGRVNKVSRVSIAGPNGYALRVTKIEARTMLRRARQDGSKRVEVYDRGDSLSIMAFHAKG